MSSVYASGRLALALCDDCAQVRPYNELRWYYHQDSVLSKPVKTNLRVCYQCFDRDLYYRLPRSDPQALENSRPDVPPEIAPNPPVPWITSLYVDGDLSFDPNNFLDDPGPGVSPVFVPGVNPRPEEPK